MSTTTEPGTAPATRITYHRLSPLARREIAARSWFAPDVTIAGYIRKHFPDREWRGDSCGCTDDRCIGYHHDETDECGCLAVLLDIYVCGVAGHRWGDTVQQRDYGSGPVRWRCCDGCGEAEYCTTAGTS